MFNFIHHLFATTPAPKPPAPKHLAWPLLKRTEFGFSWLIPDIGSSGHWRWWTVRMDRRSACRHDWIYVSSEN